MQTKPGQYQAGDNNRQLGIADLNMETVLSGDNLLVVFQPLAVFNPRIGHATSSERATREKTRRASLESLGGFHARRESSLLFADVFVPHGWIRGNIISEQFDAFL